MKKPINKVSIEHLPYRLGVGIVLLNQENRVFVGRRIDTRSEAWQMPQGGIDKGEEPQQAALRELKEEAGTDNARFIAESADWFTYDLPQELIHNIWDGRYRGQKQKWFLFRFEGTDEDINIQTEEPEFLEWKWAEFETLPELIVPFKRQLYQDVIEEFRALVRRGA